MADPRSQLKTIVDENEIISESRFQEQCFLMEFYKSFVRRNENHSYANFTKLNTRKSVASLINRLLGRGIEELMNISPFQLSLLQPKIRLYKRQISRDTNKEIDVELRFDDKSGFNRFEDITANASQLGDGAALLGFEWEDLGTNPGDSGKAFKATLEMYFNTPDDLTMPRQRSGEPETSFVDLVSVPPKQFLDPNVRNEESFRILATVGWEIPVRVRMNFSEELRRSIELSTITMFLTLTNHELDYDEKGMLRLTAEYIGAIEGKLLSPDTDVLYVGRRIEEQIQNNNRFLQRAEKNLELARKNQKEEGGFLLSTEADLIVDEFEQSIERAELQVREDKSKSYARILSFLEVENRIFYVDIPKSKLRILGQTADEQQLDRVSAAQQRAIRIKDLRERQIKNSLGHGIYDSKKAGEISSKYNKLIQDQALKKTQKEREEAIAEGLGKLTRANEPKGTDVERINYVFFGDLIDVALSVLYNGAPSDTIAEKRRRRAINNFNFLVGPLEISDFFTDEKTIVSLADIPISLNLFQAWFLKKVIKVQKEKYLLRDFLRDICSDLILSALSPSCFGSDVKNIRSKVSFSIFSFGKDANSVLKRGKIVDVDTLRNLDFLRSADARDSKHFFMMYVSGHKLGKRRRDALEDAKDGIYHLRSGADRGLVRRLKFSRADIQYLKESRIVNSSEVQQGDAFFAEPYNSSVNLYGNSIFKPGMQVYIEPASLGMGPSIPKNRRIPIGGYYSVIKVSNQIRPGEFFTQLKLNFESFGTELEGQLPTFDFVGPPNITTIDSDPNQ